MSEGVLVIGEMAEGELVGATAELLGAARTIADAQGGLVNLALFGEGADALAQRGVEYGADLVYTDAAPELTEYMPERWLQAAQTAVDFADPAVILLATTMAGRDLAARLAFRLNTAVAMDVIDFDIEGDTVHWTRPAYGGAARAVVSIATSPVIAAIRPKTQEAPEPDASRTGDTIPLGVELSGPEREKLTNKEMIEKEGIQLDEANVVVSGGRGVGGPEGFQPIEELAGGLGAAPAPPPAPCGPPRG